MGVNVRNWLESAQDRGYWRNLANALLNLRVLQATKLVTCKLNEHRIDLNVWISDEGLAHLLNE